MYSTGEVLVGPDWSPMWTFESFVVLSFSWNHQGHEGPRKEGPRKDAEEIEIETR
jgi:hypothetical protein